MGSHYEDIFGITQVLNEDSLPIRDPESKFLHEFSGIVDVVVPELFTVMFFVTDGWVTRSVPGLKSMRGRDLRDAIKRYLRHKGTYFVFRS